MQASSIGLSFQPDRWKSASAPKIPWPLKVGSLRSADLGELSYGDVVDSALPVASATAGLSGYGYVEW